MSDRPTGPDGPRSDRPVSGQPDSDRPNTDRTKPGRPSSDETAVDKRSAGRPTPAEPALPELRRFRFTDETRPGTRPPTDEPSPSVPYTGQPNADHRTTSADLSTGTVTASELSDTFDLDDLDPHEVTSAPYGLHDAPPPSFGSAPPPTHPTTGSVAPAPRGPVSGAWPRTPPTGPFPTPPATPPARSNRRRTLLIAAVVALVVVAAVAVTLIVKPFSNAGTTADPTGNAEQSAPAAATGAPPVGSAAGRASGSAPAAGAGVAASWATTICASLASYQTDASKISQNAETAAAAPTGLAALSELQTQAASLLGALHTALSQGEDYDPAVTKFRVSLSGVVLQAQTDVDPNKSSQPSSSPQTAKNLIQTSLDKPAATFGDLYDQSTGQVRADLDATTGCGAFITR